MLSLAILRKTPTTALPLAAATLYAIGFLGVQLQAARLNLSHIEMVRWEYLVIGGILMIPILFWIAMAALWIDASRRGRFLAWLQIILSCGAMLLPVKLILDVERSSLPVYFLPIAILAASLPLLIVPPFLPISWRKKNDPEAPQEFISPAGWFWRMSGLAIIAVAYLFFSSYVAMLIIPQSWGGAKAQVVRLHLTADVCPLFGLKPDDLWTSEVTLHMSTGTELALELPDHTRLVLPRSHVIAITYPAPDNPEPRP